jgi:signal transduction histidine kinase
MASKDYLNRKHGLGLVIVKQVISLHHGTIEFISAPAKGFQNIIRLPLKGGRNH